MARGDVKKLVKEKIRLENSINQRESCITSHENSIRNWKEEVSKSKEALKLVIININNYV